MSPGGGYSGLHCAAATRSRSSSGLVLGATPAVCASRPTAVAIARATARRSRTAGKSEPEAVFLAGDCSPSARAAASIIPSVTRLAPDATTPSPTAGKMNTLLHWAIGISRPSYCTGG